ncbi:hypothetical protein [Bacteroides clarus]|uniref:hypothetical protein n=1 Tax=Bacteroides clarus TaxID=626929 RepID=UPI00248D612B|nr:hypothetical protein [Bacteroides clarus]
MLNLYNGSEPIINPWLFYLADVVLALKVTLIILSVGLVIASLLYLLMWNENCEFKRDDEYNIKLRKSWLKGAKICIVSGVLSFIVGMIVPTKKTLYAMTISSALTPDTVQLIYDKTGETATDILNGGGALIEDIVDYGVDKINEMRNVEPIETEDNAE